MLRDVTQCLRLGQMTEMKHIKMLFVKFEGKRPPERPSLCWDDNIKIYHVGEIVKVVN
jgi:hypothetical protein